MQLFYTSKCVTLWKAQCIYDVRSVSYILAPFGDLKLLSRHLSIGWAWWALQSVLVCMYLRCLRGEWQQKASPWLNRLRRPCQKGVRPGVCGGRGLTAAHCACDAASDQLAAPVPEEGGASVGRLVWGRTPDGQERHFAGWVQIPSKAILAFWKA